MKNQSISLDFVELKNAHLKPQSRKTKDNSHITLFVSQFLEKMIVILIFKVL